MKYILFFLALIPIVCVGEALGLAIHCDNCEYLEPAKPFAWRVPLMQVELFWKYLKLSFKKMSPRPLKLYLGIKEKHILLLCRLARSNRTTATTMH